MEQDVSFSTSGAVALTIPSERPKLRPPTASGSLAFAAASGTVGGMTDIALPSRDQFLREEAIRGGMDLLFFAHTRHLRGADKALAAEGLGRAHHRIMYFLARRPGIHVSALLAILGITKQSFGRVANDLAKKGLIEHRPDEQDYRRRQLYLTPAGVKLERTIFEQLHSNIARAYAMSGGDAVVGFWTVLQHLIGDEGRTQFKAVQDH